MSYDKLSLASFKAALQDNKYVSATGARRAVGKATTLSDGDKEKARAAINAHFGEEAAAAAPKKTGAPKKQAAAKKTTAPKKAAAAKPAPAPKKKTAAVKRAPVHAAGPAPLAGQAIAQHGVIDLENTGSIATQMRIAEKTIQNVGAALSVLTQAKEKYPEADLGTAVEEMGGTLAGAVGIFRQVVNQISSSPATANIPAQAAPTPRQGVVNNGVVSNRAEALFNESGPEGAAAQPA